MLAKLAGSMTVNVPDTMRSKTKETYESIHLSNSGLSIGVVNQREGGDRYGPDVGDTSTDATLFL